MDGKKIAEEKFSALQQKIQEKKLSLSLAVVQVGDNPASNEYVNIKQKILQKAGINVAVYNFLENTPESKIIKKINTLNEDGIIVQLPLPKNMNKMNILNAVPKYKDVDVLSSFLGGEFYTGETKILPPVVASVQSLFNYYSIDYESKIVTVIGFGALVGKPLALFFMQKKTTVSIINSKTKDISLFTKNADIIISGAGSPGIIKGEMIKEGAILIDAGTSTDNGMLTGDIDRQSVENKAMFLAPVPGGVGPLTVYHLADNLLQLKYGF